MNKHYREVWYNVVETAKDGGEKLIKRYVTMTPVKLLNGKIVNKSDDELISEGYKRLIDQGYNNVTFISMKESWMKYETKEIK